MAKGGSGLAAPDWNAGRSPVNASAPWPAPKAAQERVLEIQRKLHKWVTTGMPVASPVPGNVPAGFGEQCRGNGPAKRLTPRPGPTLHLPLQPPQLPTTCLLFYRLIDQAAHTPPGPEEVRVLLGEADDQVASGAALGDGGRARLGRCGRGLGCVAAAGEQRGSADGREGRPPDRARRAQTAETSSSSATRKEEPQPQAATTLGFSTLKPAPWRLSA